jgi:hypothetical protein
MKTKVGLFMAVIAMAVAALAQRMPQCDPGWKLLPDGRCERDTTATSPANISATQKTFGPAFSGDNLSTVITRLKSVATPKGEFETTEQYQQRIAKAGEQFTFVVPKPPSDPDAPLYYQYAEAKYDADTQIMTVEMPVAGLAEMDKDELKQFLAVTLNAKVTPQSGYVGVNAFGVRKAIRKQQVSMLGIAIEGTIHELYSTRTFGGSFSIPPEQAQEVKPALSRNPMNAMQA